MKLAKDMNKVPSQHVAPCNGNGGYPLPTRARIATGDKYPGGGDCKIRNAIAFEDPTHSRSDGAKAAIAMHIRILVRRGRPLPLGLSPHRMYWQFCTPGNFFPCNVGHTKTSYLVYSTLVWTSANWWKTITPNTKRENGLYPPTQRSFQAFATFEQMF